MIAPTVLIPLAMIAAATTEPTAETIQGTFGTLVQYFGFPGAIFAVFIFSLYKEWIVMGKNAAKQLADATTRLEDWKARYADMDKRWADQYAANDKANQARYEKMEAEKNFWRDSSLRNIEALESTIDTAKKAVDRLPPSSNTPAA